jgi:hypothetical protein
VDDCVLRLGHFSRRHGAPPLPGREALELVQSTGCTASEAHQLVDYVFNRPIGEPGQELAASWSRSLAALANPSDLNMDIVAETELLRAWEIIDKIRAKAAAKPKYSPLPQ